MSGLSEAELQMLADWESDTFGDTLDEAPFDALVTVVERILAARVASAAAENAALKARLDEVRALAGVGPGELAADHTESGDFA